MIVISDYFTMDIFMHSSNVVEIASAISREINLPGEENAILREAALYHDIGKSQIPEEILYKRGKLNAEEWEIMKKHPVYSQELYVKAWKGKRQSPVTGKSIRHHHENWDGTGYPDGISGKNIPLYSRIIKIADIFEAITEPRVYRSYRMDNALELMESIKGKEIDPVIFEKSYNKLKELLREKASW